MNELDYYMQLLENVRDVTDGLYAYPRAMGYPHPNPFGYLRGKGYILGVPRITFLGRVVLAAHENKEEQSG